MALVPLLPVAPQYDVSPSRVRTRGDAVVSQPFAHPSTKGMTLPHDLTMILALAPTPPPPPTQGEIINGNLKALRDKATALKTNAEKLGEQRHKQAQKATDAKQKASKNWTDAQTLLKSGDHNGAYAAIV